jgi:flavin reductase (DIM6/NTAB) family NADH-FMN oxidoreductase RutF
MRISEVISPRPVALVTTCDREGRPDVATFSFIMPVSFSPKYVAFSVRPTRLTFENLKDVQEFVLNVPTEDMLEKIWICGTKSGREANKFELGKLETLESAEVKPPRIKGCPAQLECKVEFMKEFGDHFIVVGKVVNEHLEKESFRPILHHSEKVFFRIGRKVSA